jgi:GAF domain-containing protein
MGAVRTERVAEVFVEVADTLIDAFDVIEFLQMLTSRTSELIGARAVGLLLGDHQGHLQFMAASDERVHLLELFQVQAHEGPCQDCYRQGTPVINTDLRAATPRWPRFAPQAVAAGFRSVHAFPMRLRQEVIGCMGLFAAETGRMEPSNVRLVQALADVATIGLLQERAIHRGEVLTEQLQGALNSRVVIEQAKGVIAQLHGISVDEAFTMMRLYSRGNHLRLSDVANAIVADPGSIPDLAPNHRRGSR